MSQHAPEDTLHRIMAELRHAPGQPARDLHCPFSPAVHAEVEHIQARSVAWAREVGLCASPQAERRLRGAGIGRLPARAYPNGIQSIVQLAADWTTLFCLLDDHIERLAGPDEVAACLAELADLLRDGGDPGPDPLERACADLHKRLLAEAPPGWMSRFDMRVRQLFDAFSWEAAVRRAGVVPALDVYLPMREVTVGLHVEFEIGELACGAALGPRLRNHPALVTLARKASNIVGWANDIYTYEKEISQGEGTNLIAVLAHAEGISLRQALARAVAVHDEEVRSFVALSSALPYVGPGEDERLARHASMLRCWVRGHLDWGKETGRYDPGRSSAGHAASAGE